MIDRDEMPTKRETEPPLAEPTLQQILDRVGAQDRIIANLFERIQTLASHDSEPAFTTRVKRSLTPVSLRLELPTENTD